MVLQYDTGMLHRFMIGTLIELEQKVAKLSAGGSWRKAALPTEKAWQTPGLLGVFLSAAIACATTVGL